MLTMALTPADTPPSKPSLPKAGLMRSVMMRPSTRLGKRSAVADFNRNIPSFRDEQQSTISG